MSKLVGNQHHHWYRGRTFYVLVAVLLGILVGHFFPNVGMEIKPLADIFVRLIKMVIGPIVFIMIVTGISNAGDLRKAGRIGLMALVYFEIITTVALALGLLVANLAKPGSGISVAAIAKSALPNASKAATTTWIDTVVAIFPDNAVKAFVSGDLVQIIAFSIFFGCSLSLMGVQW